MRDMALVVLVGLVGCGPGERRNGSNGMACSDGQMHCNGVELQTCVGGQFVDQQACPDACSDTLGCTLCAPGTGTCNGDVSHACNDTGSEYTDTTCDPLQGMSCDPGSGLCTGACAPQNLGSSYIGCDYFPTVTGNDVDKTTFDFAIAIANTSTQVAMVTIDGSGQPNQTLSVPANSVVVQTLPWNPNLTLCPGAQGVDGCFGGVQPAAMEHKGAFHVRSTSPVTIYQFSPLEYQKNGEFSFTNDASLLMPTNVWRQKYYAATYAPLDIAPYPSELAVTASQDGTTVMIDATADTGPGGGAPGFAMHMPHPVTLDAGDVLEISSTTGDLTGSLVTSDKPVQVISGNYCTNVPVGVQYCDHLEESMFPVDTLGLHYIVNAPAVTTIPTGKVQLVRIIATADNTNLTYDPPQPGAPASIATAGGYAEIQNTSASFEITADQKVMVVQYMEGQDAGGGTGDPAMALAVPIEQFRADYLFHAPTNYESNYVDVTAPMGAAVMLDGMPLSFTPIGSTGWGIARVYPLTAGPGNDGNHQLSGSQAFGITVYGYGQYTSYWYPGGLDLKEIIN